MRQRIRLGALIPALALLAITAARAAAEWPQQTRSEKAAFLVYQPQIEAFKGNKLKTRIAVRITVPNATPVYAALTAVGRIAANRQTREVRILDLNLIELTFDDTETAKLNGLEDIVRAAVPTWVLAISMDRFLASLTAAAHEDVNAADAETDPLTVLFAIEPTVLVFIDGEPRTRPLADGPILRIVNTPFFLVYDPRSRDYYLNAGNGYLTAKELDGPWSPTRTPPSSVVNSAEAAGFSPVPAEGVPSTAVRVSTAPAVLITSDGDPQYSPAPGGGELLYVKNSANDVFLEIREHRYYILVSGRWYSNLALREGTWEQVAPADLPAAFRLIPEDSAKAYVLPHVAGTRLAQEALVDTLIPHTFAVKRTGHEPPVRFDGDPAFRAVAGADCEVATNATLPVFRVDDTYYCCNQGVWYTAEKPRNMWAVCSSVPTQLRELPAALPLQFVRFAASYDVVGDVVFVGYRPGYLGTNTSDGCIVYSSGMRELMKDVQAPYPLPFGGNPVYNPWLGEWGFRLGADDAAAWISDKDKPDSDIFDGGAWWGPGGFREAALGTATDDAGNRVQVPAALAAPGVYDRPVNQARNATTLSGLSLDLLPMWSLKGQAPPSGGDQPRTAAGSAPPTFRVANDELNNVVTDKKGRVFARVEEDVWRVRANGIWEQTVSADQLDESTQAQLEREIQVRTRGTQRTEAFRKAVGQASPTGRPLPARPAVTPFRYPGRWR
jgi:hypothetical protein